MTGEPLRQSDFPVVSFHRVAGEDAFDRVTIRWSTGVDNPAFSR